MNENSKVKVNVDDVKDLFNPNNAKQLQQHHNHQQSRPEEDAETDVETPVSSPERDSFTSPSPCTTTNTSTNTSTCTPTPNSDAIANTKEQTTQDVEEKSVPAVTPEATSSHGSSSSSSDDREDYTNWPFKDIKEPHRNDVLYGRGGGTNHHAGNKRYRKLVEGRKVDYVNSKRLDKPLVALEIIKEWRSQVPPGRFLKMNNDSGLWQDVGDKKAREKTSQALREKAPLLRKQQEEQRKEARPDNSKNTRFNVPEKLSKVSKNLSRGMLARDHSLGRDYLSAGEKVSVKGFSWTAPALEKTIPPTLTPTRAEDDILGLSGQVHVRPVSTSSSGSWENPNGHAPLPPPPSSSSNNDEDIFSYAIRGSGSGSVSGSRSRSGSSHSTRHLSPNLVSNVLSPSSHSRDSGGGSVSAKWTAPPPIPIQQPTHNPHTSSTQPSESTMMDEWRTSRYHPDIDYHHPTRSADDAYRTSKPNYYNHGGVPPPNSHLQGDDYGRFASILGSNTDPNHPHGPHPHPHPPTHPHPHAPTHNPNDFMHNWRQNSDVMYDSSSSYHSPDRIPPAYGRHGNEWTSPTASHSHSQAQPPQSPMHYYGNNSSPYSPPPPPNSQHMVPEPAHVHTPARGHAHVHGHSHAHANPHSIPIDTRETIPRPPTVKRDTSHKLQTMDIEPTTKRLNRQSSIGHRNVSSMSSVEEITEKDIKHLNTSLKQSSLAGKGRDTPIKKPASLIATDRVATFNSFDVAALDDDDVGEKKDHETDVIQQPPLVVNKPQSLTSSDRLTTFDHFIVDMEGSSSSLDANGQKIQRQSSQTSLDFSEVGDGDVNGNGDEIGVEGMMMKPSPISANDRFSTLGTLDSDFMGKITNSTSV